MTIYTKPEAQARASTPIDIDTLEIIADWRQDLSTRLERARLRHELIGLSPETIIELGEEARDFSRLCRTLKAVTR